MLFCSSGQDDNVIKPMEINQHDLLQPLGVSTIQTVRRNNHGPIQPTRICAHDLNQAIKRHTVYMILPFQTGNTHTMLFNNDHNQAIKRHIHDPTFSNGKHTHNAIQPTSIHMH
jgi:hypothetical protein